MKALKKIYIALIMLFLYAPMLVMVVFSFNASNSTSVMSGFSLKWYVEMFRNATALTALRNTLVLAVTSALISIIIGTAAAVGINAMKKRWLRSAVMTVTNVPMMNPEIVTGVSMMLLFVFAGKIVSSSSVLGFPTLLIAHVTFNLPYVILSVLPKLRQTDRHLSEAAPGPRLHTDLCVFQGCASQYQVRYNNRLYNGIYAFAGRLHNQLFCKRRKIPDSSDSHFLNDKEEGKTRYVCVIDADICIGACAYDSYECASGAQRKEGT